LKIARAKAPHTAGKSLVKPAAVQMARTVCGDALTNEIAMVPCQTTPSSGTSCPYAGGFGSVCFLGTR